MKPLFTLALICASVAAAPVESATPVSASPDAEALFKSRDPKLQRNKQAAYHIVRDLLEANHWELAGRWIARNYIQHNPNAADGLDAVVGYFTTTLHRQPTPIPARLTREIVSVVAEGDLVVVTYVQRPGEGAGRYTTTSFDMWRFADGKAIEHWDGQTKPR